MRRGEIPEMLKTAPELQMGLDIFWDAFGVLSTTRQLGQGFVGPIPWDKVQDYCDRMEIDDEEQRERMLAYLRKMDRVFQDHVTRKVRDKWQTNSAPSP